MHQLINKLISLRKQNNLWTVICIGKTVENSHSSTILKTKPKAAFLHYDLDHSTIAFYFFSLLQKCNWLQVFHFSNYGRRKKRYSLFSFPLWGHWSYVLWNPNNKNDLWLSKIWDNSRYLHVSKNVPLGQILEIFSQPSHAVDQ